MFGMIVVDDFDQIAVITLDDGSKRKFLVTKRFVKLGIDGQLYEATCEELIEGVSTECKELTGPE